MTFRFLLALALSLSIAAGGIHGQDAAPEKAATAGEKEKAPIPVAQKEKTKNDIRRLLQNSKIERCQKLVNTTLKKAADHPENRDLLAFACWAKAVLEGNRGGTEEELEQGKAGCLEYFDRAIENGWRNPFAFQYAALIRDEIRESAEFKSRVEKLADAFEAEERESFQERLESGLASAEQGGSPLPLPRSVASSDALSALLRGRPALLVVTPVLHDGFLKVIPLLRQIHAEYAESVPVLVLFYQTFADDEHRVALTAQYVEDNEITAPYAIVTRDDIRDLGILEFPAFLFRDAGGRLVFRQEGLLHERFMGKFVRLALDELEKRAPEPEPPAEEPAAPPDEPAKEPEKDAEEKPADQPVEEPPAETPKPPAEKPEKEPEAGDEPKPAEEPEEEDPEGGEDPDPKGEDDGQ